MCVFYLFSGTKVTCSKTWQLRDLPHPTAQLEARWEKCKKLSQQLFVKKNIYISKVFFYFTSQERRRHRPAFCSPAHRPCKVESCAALSSWLRQKSITISEDHQCPPFPCAETHVIVTQTHGIFSSNQDILISFKILILVLGLFAQNLCKSAYSVYKTAMPGHVRALVFNNGLKNSREWWSSSDVGDPLWTRLSMFLGLTSAEQRILFSLPKTEQNKNKGPKNSSVFLMLFCFRHDWKNTYACDFLLQMSEGWQYWTQRLVKCTESVTIETSM